MRVNRTDKRRDDEDEEEEEEETDWGGKGEHETC